MKIISLKFRKYINRIFVFVYSVIIGDLSIGLYIKKNSNPQRVMIKVVLLKYGIQSIKYQFIDSKICLDKKLILGFMKSSYFNIERYMLSGGIFSDDNFFEDFEEYKIDVEVINGMQGEDL